MIRAHMSIDNLFPYVLRYSRFTDLNLKRISQRLLMPCKFYISRKISCIGREYVDYPADRTYRQMYSG